jgi:ABC-type lipoprotein export system ATPase subunit
MTGTASEPTLAVDVRNVLRIYPAETSNVAALRGLDLQIAPGEIVAIVGPSGSGKSTLLRILAGLDRPSAGTASVFGTQLERASEAQLARFRRDVVSSVEQHYWRAISPYLTARQTVELPLLLRGRPRAARRARSDDLLARVGLPDRGDARPSQLSGGEQQRIAFAAALSAGPRLIVADEPTGELDEATAERLLRLLRELVRAEQATAIVVSHDRLIEATADRVIHLHDGRAIGVRGPDGALAPVVDESGWRAPEVAARPAGLAKGGTTDAGRPAVEIDGVTRGYGHGESRILAVDELTTSFGRGGLHVITGPSGSGKSTLLRLIVGLDRPDHGRIRTLGIDLAGLDRTGLAALRADRVALMPQAPRLVPFLSAVENVELGLAVRGRSANPAERRSRAMAALERVGMAPLATAVPDVLSGGERARLALARALAADPELLVLDEPTAALDRSFAVTIIGLLAELDPSITAIVATHDRDLIDAATDRLDLRDVRRAHAAAAG